MALIITIALILLASIAYFLFFKKERHLPLEIDLIPLKMHEYNVRSRISSYNWQKVCALVHAEASGTTDKKQFKCQLCGEQGFNQVPYRKHAVECHEKWEFDARTRTQRLAGLMSLCPACHRVHHLGKAISDGYALETKAHLRKVNSLTPSQAEAFIAHAINQVKTRSHGGAWKLDLTYLNRPEFSFLKETFTDNERWKIVLPTS